MTTRLEKIYKEEVVPVLMKRFGYTNPMQVPKITKITLNMGVGEAAANKKVLENALADMAKIAGQKPVATKSRVSVASFKIRDGWPIGAKVTLRRALVTAVRAIPPKPTRRGAPHRAIGIEDLHLIMTKGQPGLETSWLGEPDRGWLLRAGRGWTGRSNSALPIGSPDLPLEDAIDAVESWYTGRDLSSLVMLPRPLGAAAGDDPLGHLLLDRGYRELPVADVLTGRTADLAAAAHPAPSGMSVTHAEHADDAWLLASSPRLTDHLAAAREILTLPARQVFLTAHDDEGGTIGVARVALDDGWAGIYGVNVAPEHRRRGLGRLLTSEAARAAQAGGASLAYLQVERHNTAARSLYTGLGMRPHHEYSYLGRRRA